jgi:hypothetical protein
MRLSLAAEHSPQLLDMLLIVVVDARIADVRLQAAAQMRILRATRQFRQIHPLKRSAAFE